MIVQALMDLVYGLFSLLTSPINIPSLPDGVASVLSMLTDALGTGLGLLACYTHLGYLITLFGLIVAVDAGLMIYKFVMWILRKIPMFGIS